MTVVRRLTAVGTVLGLAAALTCTHVWGEPGRGKSKDLVKPADGTLSAGKADEDFARDMAVSRFTNHPLATYQAGKGAPLLWALQLKPNLTAAPRPLDVLVLISDAAGMAQGPLAAAQKTAETLAASLGADDRMAVCTINVDVQNLSKSEAFKSGFRPGAKLKDAFKDLAKDYPSGAVDLKKGLAKALETFEGDDSSRQRVILFFGDGKSLANPLIENDRAALCDDMVKHEIAFFAVPLGSHIDSANLHGLVSGTGGNVVRTQHGDKPEDLVNRLKDAFAQPILYPTAFQAPLGATDVMPTHLPPLRGDAGTLVMGKLPAGAAKFSYSVTGTVSGKAQRIEASEAVPAPEVENFFLVEIASQWHEQKDQPALLQADRALAFAAEQHELAREDLLAKAFWALDEDKIDPAFKLFEQARKFDPTCAEAKAGLDIVAQIRDGKLTKEQLFQELKHQRKAAKDTRLARADDPLPPVPPAAPEPLPAPGAGRDLLLDVEARQAVANQQGRQLVDDAIRRANQRVLVQPADAVQDLKQTLEDVRNNPDLSEAARVNLVDRLQRASQTVDRTSRNVLVAQEQAQAEEARAAASLAVRAEVELVQEQTRERMRQFADLMHLAREESAYLQASSIRDDLVAQGQPVPVSVTASAKVSLVGFNLRELRRIRSLKEERWLAVLLSVDNSSIPFPDEPPIRFPDAAYIKQITKLRYGAAGSQFDNWKDFSEYRLNVKRYGSSTFGSEESVGRALEFQKMLNQTITYELPIDVTLDKALNELLTRVKIPWTVNDAAFGPENKNIIKTTQVEKIDKLEGVTRATVLKRLLAKIPNDSGKTSPTYLIRPDSVEITTTDAATRDKVVRVYPVADLVTPIGGAIPVGGIFGVIGQPNQLGGSAVGNLGGQQMAGGLGALGGGLGALGGGLGALGGGLGVLGGGLGALGGGLGALGGGLGALGGGFGALGGGGLGQGGFQGQQGGQQQQNPSYQNAVLQIQQAQQLIGLIKQVVGDYRDWQKPIDATTGKFVDPNADGDSSPLTSFNDLGYYGPAQALVVKAQTRVHTRASDPLSYGSATVGAMGLNNVDRDRKVQVAGAGKERVGDHKAELDPKVIWQDALAKGVDDPGLIIACADFLAQTGKWGHAAEFLKADLRQGIVVRPWVYKSLAIALRQSGGAADEIERAEMSSAELEPLDAQGYLDASRAMAGDKRWDRALAFAKQAAVLEPNTPYAYNEALLYAESARDEPGMEWAAGHLLRQDWPVGNQALQGKAIHRVKDLANTLERENRQNEAARLLGAVESQRQRDLVFKLSWQGEADLDLKVKEPTGSVCWVLNRQTIGGGTLTGDAQSDRNSETYQAAKAFSGDYEVTVDRVWGAPLSNKAQLKIIRHQGTPQQSEELMTIDLKNGGAVKVNLTDGRRTEVAYVPPPSSVRPISEAVVKTTDRCSLMNKLRKMSEPEVQGVTVGIHGSTVGMGETMPTSAPASMTPMGGEQYQSKLSSFIANSLEVTTQATMAADRRSMRVSMTPVFNTATDAKPVVSYTGIPGSREP
jgi:tetratricopeptide (TPR) repeat protein